MAYIVEFFHCVSLVSFVLRVEMRLEGGWEEGRVAFSSRGGSFSCWVNRGFFKK
jgi:hypothetical protein